VGAVLSFCQLALAFEGGLRLFDVGLEAVDHAREPDFDLAGLLLQPGQTRAQTEVVFQQGLLLLSETVQFPLHLVRAPLHLGQVVVLGQLHFLEGAFSYLCRCDLVETQLLECHQLGPVVLASYFFQALVGSEHVEQGALGFEVVVPLSGSVALLWVDVLDERQFVAVGLRGSCVLPVFVSVVQRVGA